MRILFAANFRWRGLGDIGFNADRKLLSGLIKNDYAVLEFSDRDMPHLDNPLGLKPVGVHLTNRRFLEAVQNFEPDLIILGLADIVRNETIESVRAIRPNVHIAHWNVDALFMPETLAKIKARAAVCDSLFLTTAGPPLAAMAADGRLAAYLPNPTDAAMDPLDNSRQTRFDHDLIYFGVGNPTDPRWALVGELEEKLGVLRFTTYGSHGHPKVLGRARDRVLASAKMALNLNRFEGDPLYSSDRISYLMPNGIVTFTSRETGLQRFFSADEAVFFQTPDEIISCAKALHEDDAKRQAIAAAGRLAYRRMFNSKRVAAFLVETAMGLTYSDTYEWADEVYRA